MGHHPHTLSHRSSRPTPPPPPRANSPSVCSQRPFVCEVCEADFLRASHLKAHARSHMDEADKPSQCEECDKRFWTNQHLKKHVDTMHRGKTYDVSRHSRIAALLPRASAAAATRAGKAAVRRTPQPSQPPVFSRSLISYPVFSVRPMPCHLPQAQPPPHSRRRGPRRAWHQPVPLPPPNLRQVLQGEPPAQGAPKDARPLALPVRPPGLPTPATRAARVRQLDSTTASHKPGPPPDVPEGRVQRADFHEQARVEAAHGGASEEGWAGS